MNSDAATEFATPEGALGDAGEVESPVDYDGEPVVEVLVGDTCYRLDPARNGRTLGLSNRAVGTWRWSYLAELKWDGSSLRGRGLDRQLLECLARSLSEATLDSSS